MASIFDENSISNQNKIYEVPAGTVILNEGEINFDMYKIVSGHVEMYYGYGTENEVLLGILGPGTCFGEFGILTGQPAIYTIITYSNARILRVTEALMGNFIKENPENIMQIMKNMANNMLKMQHQIAQLSEEVAEAKKMPKYDPKTEQLLKNILKNYALSKPADADNSDDKSGKFYFMNKDHDKSGL
ncbi:MAG: Crp/Fnr family transcriptional regulator [Butyrivibrio sp.]|uniref:Crp/Fnr family transcriptional regulator n=1 Tax=Butyrivibrio sp. NC2002 TaxID=1410610 RepID=UPI00055EB006|nr:Crp/Fnr family transcriptional regulator [Butyrivibrio sp. NC2002]MBE5860796.1 Crp/Fnr family transcriptional regulator [Butyrivibrio sp.]